VADDLDADTLVELSVLSEMELQCEWALQHLRILKEHASKLQMKRVSRRGRDRMFAERTAVFREIQSILTCAGIADSLLTGKGPPRPRGLEGVSDAQRASIRAKLNLPLDFVIPGRPQRNALIHIEERRVPWSRPGNMRGDMATAPTRIPDHPGNRQTLRAFSVNPLEFLVLGERCSLDDVEASLQLLGRAANRAADGIFAAENAKRSA
jgi:hypothetical protein